jgi:hypothetical protein
VRWRLADARCSRAGARWVKLNTVVLVPYVPTFPTLALSHCHVEAPARMTHPKWKRRAKKGKTQRQPYHTIAKTNAAFESYYQVPLCCPCRGNVALPHDAAHLVRQ